MLRTPVCEKLGVERPTVQAPMAAVPLVAAAVSNAGAPGMVTLAWSAHVAHFASGEAIVRYGPAPPMVGTTGDIEALSLWAGQSVALAREVQPAAEIVDELVSGLQTANGYRCRFDRRRARDDR